MNCIVTAGPSCEWLDDVRLLTNFSTGRLGSELANYLVAQGHTVTLLLGQQSTWRGERYAQKIVPFTTTASLRDHLQAMAGPAIHAVFHAAAVSDFAFGKVWRRTEQGELVEIQSGKISSRVESLLVEMVPTPKVISSLRAWFPNAFLVGWKYEVDGDRPSTIAEAEKQIAENRTNICVANGPAYGRGFGIVTGPGECAHAEDLKTLFGELSKCV